jgi:amidase
VRAGVDRAAGWLADAGYHVVDAEPPQIAEATEAWVEVMFADAGVTWPLMEPVAGTGLREFIEACFASGVGKPVDQAAQLAAWEAVHMIGAAWTAFLEEHPIVLSPVCCERPWIVGEDINRVDEIAGAMRVVVPVNVLGLPACAVPVGSDEGLPQGVQLIGGRFREDLILAAAQTIEDRAPVLTPISPRVRVAA